MGYLEVVRERGDLATEVADQFAAIERKAARLVSLAADLLHVAQASECGPELKRTEVELAALVREAAARHAVAATGNDLCPDLPVTLVGLLTASGSVRGPST